MAYAFAQCMVEGQGLLGGGRLVKRRPRVFQPHMMEGMATAFDDIAWRRLAWRVITPVGKGMGFAGDGWRGVKQTNIGALHRDEYDRKQGCEKFPHAIASVIFQYVHAQG
ncbi:MAG: hypothetical protein ACOY99_04925 [Pseudomonadota bacterium]